MKRILISLFLASAAVGATVEFVPPNDTLGSVFSNNSNDGWSSGRGIIFTVDSPTLINSVGLLHNLNNTALSYELSVFNSTVLQSGGSTVTTSGLQWIDYSFGGVTLLPSTTYHLEFTHSGSGIQNFFYNNGNALWNQDGFSALDGTQANSTSNFVVAAFRVNTVTSASVPDTGATVGLMVLSLAGLAAFRRRFGATDSR